MDKRPLQKHAPCIENEVRLNGQRLQVCHNQEWGIACYDRWTLANRRVLCDQLGFPSEAPPPLKFSTSYYDAPVILKNIRCRGTENNILNCIHAGYGNYSECIYNAGVMCEITEACSNPNAVRLTQYGSDSIGRLEICSSGIWGSVCNAVSTATNDIAKVVCRQLGHLDTGYEYKKENIFSLQNIVPVKRTQMKCTGYEDTVSLCYYTRIDDGHICNHHDDLFVSCQRRHCNETDIKLFNGKTSSYGHVEVCLNGQWGLICNDRWDAKDAAVVCRQLGYNGSSYPLLSHSFTDTRSLPLTFHLNNVNCNGSESKLIDCYNNEFNSLNCAQQDAAGVICSDIICEHGTVHLVGGDDSSRGRVEYCYEGKWYSVCANGWDGEEARVVCKTMGYDTTFSKSVTSHFGIGTTPILQLNIQCTVNDNILSDCTTSTLDTSHCQHVAGIICSAPCITSGLTDCSVCGSRTNCWSYWSNCSCYSDCYAYGDCCPDISYVQNCFAASKCNNGDIHLVGGMTNSTGRLELCANGIWGRVCNALQFWGPDNAKVVCRQLGFSEIGAYMIHDTMVFGESEHPAVVGEVHCVGTESELLECSHGSIGKHLCGVNKAHNIPHDVIVSCYDENTSCEDGDVRLQDGTNPSNGRVEMCQYRVWRAVCSNEWDNNDARVVCRQLSYNAEDGVAMKQLEGDENIPVILEVKCTGLETYLNECSTAISTKDCNRARVACTKTIKKSTDDASITGGSVAGVLIFVSVLVVGITAVILLIRGLKRANKSKKMERIQMDILQLHDQPVLNSVESTINETVGGDNETIAKTNAYSVRQERAESAVSIKPQEVHENYRSRVHSHHLRELTLGKLILKYENIQLLDSIGEGEFGIVYKAKLSLRGWSSREVAVKTLKGDFCQLEVNSFVEESLKMSRFKHSHVMGLIGVCLDAGPTPLIIMPYMHNGSLLKYLKKERNTIVLHNNEDEDDIKAVCKRLAVMCSQIASGMEYLAAEKYIHRDLAARNCMIDKNFVIKISDFGLSEDVFVKNYFRQDGGEEVVKLPVKWMAPESLSDGHFSEKSDVWSYGVTMWEIFSGGRAPYPGTDPISVLQGLEEGNRMPKPYNTACTDEMYAMMRSCWAWAPDDRPNFNTLHVSLSQYIEITAGYLEMGFNPFSPMRRSNSLSVEDINVLEKTDDTGSDFSSI